MRTRRMARLVHGSPQTVKEAHGKMETEWPKYTLWVVGKGWTALLNRPIVVKTRDDKGDPTEFGWTPTHPDDDPPNEDNMRYD